MQYLGEIEVIWNIQNDGCYIVNNDAETYFVAKLGDDIKIGGIADNEEFGRDVRKDITRVFNKDVESKWDVYGNYRNNSEVSLQGSGENVGDDGLARRTYRGGSDGGTSLSGDGKTSSIRFKRDSLYRNIVDGKVLTESQIESRYGKDVA